MLIDLHVHTTLSRDSNTSAESYLRAAANNPGGLGAICFTEHRLYPTDPELDLEYAALEQKYGVQIFKGIEADTNLGHLLIFGASEALRHRFDLTARMHRAERLIEMVHETGGVAIPAHPFRDSGYGPQLDTLLAKVGPALHTIEAFNGQNSAAQNREGHMACEKLGLNEIAGSDAHFASPEWFMTCATEFEREVRSVEQLCLELRAGRFQPVVLAREAGGKGERAE